MANHRSNQVFIHTIWSMFDHVFIWYQTNIAFAVDLSLSSMSKHSSNTVPVQYHSIVDPLPQALNATPCESSEAE